MYKGRSKKQVDFDKQLNYYIMQNYSKVKPEREYPGLAYAKEYEKKVKEARKNDRGHNSEEDR